jgi:hypothetical protein
VTEYVTDGHKLYRSSAPNYHNDDDSTQMLTPTALKYLKDNSIDSIISFNACPYTVDEKQQLADANIDYLHLAVEDFTAPTLTQLKSAIEFFNQPNHHSTLLHCGFGYGRTTIGVISLQLNTTRGCNPIESEWKFETGDQKKVLQQLRDELVKGPNVPALPATASACLSTSTSPSLPQNIMGPIDTGRYTISNARFGNLAVLSDAHDESDVVAKTEENDAGEKVCLIFC